MKVKNIVFSGFMAAILGATGANAAINVASQGYVDSKVGAVETNITNNYLTKTDAQSTYLTESQVQEEIKDVVGDSTSGVIADVAANKAAIEALDNTYATDADLDTAKETLQDAIDDEVAARGQADTALDSRLQELEKFSGDGEGSVARQIADAVAGEASLREAADADLQGKIDAINNETTGILADAKAYTNTEVGKVNAKFADYTTTDALNTKLNDYATTTALKAEEDARKAADEATTEALKDYTKTADLDAGFVTEDEMTTFKSENNTAIADAKKAGTDANAALEAYKTTNNAAVEAAKNQADKGVADAATAKAAADKAQGEVDTLEGKVSTLETELATKIDAPAACEKQDCVLSINKASGTITWVPLTEPVSEFLNK